MRVSFIKIVLRLKVELIQNLAKRAIVKFAISRDQETTQAFR